MPQVRDEADEEQQAIFQRGTDVGKLAEQLFPGGVDARPPNTYSYQQSVADTARYISEPLYTKRLFSMKDYYAPSICW
ncbi:MAG: hypothetical protein JWQ09_221 [Segetibacter sp.]|nr:hypothetical protein [Segetibacter sp.]